MASSHTPTINGDINGKAGKHAAAVSITAVDRVTLTINHLTINGLLSQKQEQQEHGSAASFRNIMFAEIPGRWHEARLLDVQSQKGLWDATNWGPRPLQTVDTMPAMTGHLCPRLSVYNAMSEFECLNLNVYTPVTALQDAARNDPELLPVIVWIHGGSFEWGDGSCECDGQYLVNRSIQTSRPVLMVSINYRLGMLGFFTSKELRQEARHRGEAGCSNLGLHDQRLALQWLHSSNMGLPILEHVHNNIHFFGGDASRILLAGESARAISVLAHLGGKVPVATSALLMSPATIGSKPFAESQRTFDKVCGTLGVAGQEMSASEKLAALRRLSCEQSHELGANRLESILCDDPVFFQEWSGQRFEEVPTFPPWIMRVVVGELREEMGVMGHH
ncbi:hypothetical protein J3459_009776 [Metarhizium acridum]|nr:hypothetical protein J3459_009776 [Metarhizium acridum]